MPAHFQLQGSRGGASVALPDFLDAISISTSRGVIHIDLTAPVADMVLLSAVSHAGHVGEVSPVRLVVSPMPSGRLAVGAIHAS